MSPVYPEESQQEGCKLDRRKDFPLGWDIGSDDIWDRGNGLTYSP